MIPHQLETASIGYPITRLGVSLFPVYVRQHPAHVATGAATGVQIGEKPDNATVTGQALVWDDVLVHASAFALAA